MITRVGKWGNSLAIRVPKEEADELHWEPNTPIKTSVVDGMLVIERATIIEAPTYTLEELLAGITLENLHPEIGTGYAVGNEVW